LDSAASAALANWKAEVLDASVVGQNTGATLFSACADPATGTVHLVYTSSAAGTGGVVGNSYIPITATSLGVPTFGTRVTVDTTAGTGTVAICVDVNSLLYAFFSTGAVGTAGVVNYRTMASGGSSFGSSTATNANTAGDGLQHVIGRDYAISGYVPLLFQVGTATFAAWYDNAIAAGAVVATTSGAFLAFM
jgi:hypothetical protein